MENRPRQVERKKNEKSRRSLMLALVGASWPGLGVRVPNNSLVPGYQIGFIYIYIYLDKISAFFLYMCHGLQPVVVLLYILETLSYFFDYIYCGERRG
jgi:hypothetical protein